MKTNKGKRKTGTLRLILPGIVLLVVGALFIRNNYDCMSVKIPIRPPRLPRVARQEKSPAPAPVAAAAGQAEQADVVQALKSRGDSVQPPAALSPQPQSGGSEPVMDTAERAVSFLSVEIPDVRCTLADPDTVIIVISLKLLFQGAALEQEVLLKREDLKVMLRKEFAALKLSDIVVDRLRGRLKAAMNTLLEKGSIEDIEFIKFQPLL